jgi:hypothetical protein
MFIGVIHNPDNTERHERLLAELSAQGLTDYQIFPAIHDIRSVKRGINLAHKYVIEYAQVAGFEEVCVMEDDIRATDLDSWNFFLANKPEDFDIYLSGIYLGDINPDNTVREFSGFHCYVVKSKFYEAFLSVPDDEHIDRALAGLGRFVVCNPFAFIQYDGVSSNTGKYESYSRLLQGRNLYKK